MGGDLVYNDDKIKSSSLTKVFEEQFPYFLAIGMSYEEYWHGNCWLTQYYLKAWKIKREMRNEELWLQGAYFFEALCDIAPVICAYPKRGAKPHEYLKEPFPLHKKTKEEEEREAERERDKALDFFKKWAASVQSKIENEK